MLDRKLDQEFTKALSDILKLGRLIEDKTTTTLDVTDLASLEVLLKSQVLQSGSDSERIQKAFAKLPRPLSLRDFLNFLVPIERLLDASPADHQILIHNQDGKQTTSTDRTPRPVVFILDHIRSAFNVGNIFRLADALSIQSIDLVGYTPTPDQASVQKTALGSQNTVPWKQWDDLSKSLLFWREKGFQIFALETAEPSKTLFECEFSQRPTAVVVGNERFGLLKKDLSLCDGTIHVPMFGFKNSLNVANCLSIVAYEWYRQNSK